MNEERFWQRMRKQPSGCWEWMGARQVNGYGAASYKGATHATHRLAWMLAHGPLPPGRGYHGTVVAHRCDNRSCCNPDHLFLTDNRGNQIDRVIKGRNSAATLTDAQARKVVERIVEGARATELAEEFNVSVAAIRSIAKKRTWRHHTADIVDLRFAPRECDPVRMQTADRAKVSALLASGKSMRQIAKECGTTHTTVARIARELQQCVETPFRRMNETDRERIHDLYRFGHSQREIAEWTGLSQASVSRTLAAGG
jgi:DNA-binding NarL/FixJ family response regulator